MPLAVDKIASSVMTLEKQLSVCTRCGSCQTVCPVYIHTGREADVARGKLALLDGLAVKMFDTPAGVLERLERCLLCGSCAHHCPVGVDVLEIFTRARCIIKEVMGLSPVHRGALRMILAAPTRFNRLMGAAGKVQAFVFGNQRRPDQTASIPIGPSRIRNRRFVPLAPISFQEKIRRGDISIPSKATFPQPRVVFFTGCLLDKLFPEAAHAATTAICNTGAQLILPTDQGCCGMPAISAGDFDSFTRLVTYHVALLSKLSYEHLVTACASCASMIKTLWPTLIRPVSEQLYEQVSVIANKTEDITQFIFNAQQACKSPASNASPPIPVTYHDPCHLKKTLGIAREPRQLIQANPRYRLVEMDNADVCCGMGGTFNWQHYDLSRQIGARKRDDIVATGAAIVATACPACMMQLKDMLTNSTPQIKVKHVIEL